MSDDLDTKLNARKYHEQAAEYALGSLNSAEMIAFEEQLAKDPALRTEVARWEKHFAALATDFEEVVPPRSVFEALKQELWDENKLPWHRRLRIWEYALGAVAAALVTYAFYFSDSFSIQSATVLQAYIQDEQSGLQVVLDFSETSDVLRVEFSGAAPQTGRSYEVWALANGATPVSMGVLPLEAVAALRLSEEQAALLRAGVTLALSDEPIGGSPSGIPTGKVLGTGIAAVTNAALK